MEKITPAKSISRKSTIKLPSAAKSTILPRVISTIYGFTFITFTRMLLRTAANFSFKRSFNGFCSFACSASFSSAAFFSASTCDALTVEPPSLFSVPSLSEMVLSSVFSTRESVASVSSSFPPLITLNPQYRDPCSPFPIATPAAMGSTESSTLRIPVAIILRKYFHRANRKQKPTATPMQNSPAIIVL